MNTQELINQIKEKVSAVLQQTPEGQGLWLEFLTIHPADIARFFTDLDITTFQKLFLLLPPLIQSEVFENLPDTLQVPALEAIPDKEKALLLSTFPLDELTDLFDLMPEKDIKKYLTLLSTQDRQTVLSLMKFDPESAGGIMDTDVLTLIQHFTVKQSIVILRRLQPRIDLHRKIFVTDQDNRLVGYIGLEQLVVKDPITRLSSFMEENEIVIGVYEDREEVAAKMIHYGETIAPVVGQNNYFLGAIPSETLVEVIGQEASEDLYRISAMPPIKYTYFQTPYMRILYERSYILIILLLAQSFSSMIIKRHEALLTGFLTYFITMLISTGGNSSSQTSAVAIQGMASGEIRASNMNRFLKREFLMALNIGMILSFFSFVRIYLFPRVLMNFYDLGIEQPNFYGSIAVSLSLFCVVLVSVVLGSSIPLLLKRLNIDPAFAAGPFLATLMDILGLLIYCYISQLILGM